MDIVIVGRHTRVSDEMRERIIAKLEKLAALAPRATRAEVHVVHERNRKIVAEAERVEITMYGRHVVRAEASAEDRMAALEIASTRIADQLRKLHERRAKRHKGKPSLHAVVQAELAAVEQAAPAQERTEETAESVVPWEGAPDTAVREIPLDGTPIMIRSKTHKAAPMSVADAIDQMELVGHDFYLFVDADTGLPSAVYRRRGWTYGVIHLEQTEVEEERETA